MIRSSATGCTLRTDTLSPPSSACGCGSYFEAQCVVDAASAGNRTLR